MTKSNSTEELVHKFEFGKSGRMGGACGNLVEGTVYTLVLGGVGMIYV